MQIRLARIDDRLIHGQVVTVWSKEAQADRILIVDDEVAQDEVRRVLLKQAAPPGVKVNVVSVEKAIKVFKNPKYDADKVFFLFTAPYAPLALVKADVPIKSVNVGGMLFKEGRTQVTKAVSVTPTEASQFKELHDLGVELDLRCVASDPKEDFFAKLQSAGLV
jgi:PTS system sorbose-specific IIB component